MPAARNIAQLQIEAWSAPDESQGELLRLREQAAQIALARCLDYPEQLAALETIMASVQSVLEADRRAGKSDGIMRLVFSLLVTRDQYVVRILTTVLEAPSDNFLKCAHQESFLDLVDKCGLSPYCRVLHTQGSVKSIRFDWGSELHVEDVAHMRSIDRKRGFAAHFYWADEAQAIELLPVVYLDLILPTMGDLKAKLVLSGTPGYEIDTMFYTVSTGEDSEWSVVRYWSWDNPHFGPDDATRWSYLCDTVIQPGRLRYGLNDEDMTRLRALTRDERVAISVGEEPAQLKEWVKNLDPALLRERFGRWVRGGADYVYRWHEAPDLYWGQVANCMYSVDDSIPVLSDDLAERIKQLPTREAFGRTIPYSWQAVLGLDAGTENGPSGFGYALLVWSRTYPKAIVLWAENKDDIHLGEALEHAVQLCSTLQTNGIPVNCVVGDLISTGVSVRQWATEFATRLPSECPLKLPAKAHKHEQIAIVNLDLMAGRLQTVAGDDLDIEGRNLRWRAHDPDKVNSKPVIHKWRMVTLPDNSTRRPGDHILDALRYAAPECFHLWQESDPVSDLDMSPAQLSYRRLVESERRL